MNELWTIEDCMAGLCHLNQVGSPKPEAPPPAPPIEVEDLSVVEKALRLYHSDPDAAHARYPSIVNKLIDAELRRQHTGLPPVSSHSEWNTLCQRLVKAADGVAPSEMTTQALLLVKFHELGYNLTRFKTWLLGA